MLGCYVSESGIEPVGPNRIAASAAYLVQMQDRKAFDRRWRHLLMKHDIAVGEPGNWRAILSRDAQHREEILRELSDAAAVRDRLGFVVAIPQSTWSRLPFAQRRRFGSAHMFCFLRLIRLVMDRLESVQEASSMAVLLRRDINSMDRDAAAASQLLKFDSRFDERVEHIAFVDPRRDSQFAATEILLHRALAQLSGGRPDGRASLLLQVAQTLPPMGSDASIEMWDDAYAKRHFASMEWGLPSRPRVRPRRPK